MDGYCTLVLYFHSPAARENTTAHSCNIQPYCPLTHQIIYIYEPLIFTVYWRIAPKHVRLELIPRTWQVKAINFIKRSSSLIVVLEREISR